MWFDNDRTMDTNNHDKIALLELLKASLYGVEPIFLDHVNWDAVLEEAREQTVAALAAKAVPRAVASAWQESVLQNQANFVRVLHGQSQLVNLFEQAGIPLVILKGAAAAVYYPEPFRRAMGDVDFLVPQERFEEAAALMEKNGYVLSHPATSENPRHLGYTKNGVMFELHHHFSHDDLDIDDVLIDGMNHLVWATIGNCCFPMLPRLSNGLVLLDHLRHHLKTGLGLRQVIDWMMYVNVELDDSFWETEFGAVAKEKGLDNLAKTVTRMCQLWLGLPGMITWCADADEGLCGQLLDSLFSSGNFGRKRGEQGHVEAVGARIRNIGLFRYLQITGEASWDAYKRHRVLKPFCWIYRGFQVAKRGLNTGRGVKIAGDLDRSRDRYELLKKLGVY